MAGIARSVAMAALLMGSLLVVDALLFGEKGAKNPAEDVNQKVEEVVQDAKKSGDAWGDKAREQISSMADKLTGGDTGSAHQPQEQSKGFVDTTLDAAAAAKAKVTDTISGAHGEGQKGGEKVEEVGSGVSGKAQEIGQAASGKAQEVSQAAMEKASDAAKSAQETLEAAKRNLEQTYESARESASKVGEKILGDKESSKESAPKVGEKEKVDL